MCIVYAVNLGHGLKCEKGMLNPCILCANIYKNHDVYMSSDVAELSENSRLNVTTKMHQIMCEISI